MTTSGYAVCPVRLERADFLLRPWARRRAARVVALATVVGLHGGVAVIVATMPSHAPTPAGATPLETVFVHPIVIKGPARGVASTAPLVHVPLDAPRDASLLVAPELVSTVIVNGVGTMAPHIDDSPSGVPAPVSLPELPPGSVATVVLRLEILSSGDIGQVAIDVSSGSEPIDRAAMTYIRSTHWTAGEINGVSATFWLRWPINLVGAPREAIS